MTYREVALPAWSGRRECLVVTLALCKGYNLYLQWEEGKVFELTLANAISDDPPRK
jgi:hypothetical protein